MYLRYDGLLIWIRALAQHSGLGLEFIDELGADGKPNVPFTDGKAIYVTHPSIHWDDDKATLWKYAVWHELGHNTPETRDCFAVAEKHKIAMNSFLGGMLNIIEDFRQEYNRYDEFAEKKRILENGHALAMSRKMKFLAELPSGALDDPRYAEAKMMETLWLYDLEGRRSWQTKCYLQKDDLKKVLKNYSDMIAWSEELDKPEWTGRLLSLNTAEDSLQLALDIIEKVFKLDPEEEKKKAQEQYKAEHGEGGKGEGDKKGKGNPESDRAEILKKLEHGEKVSGEEMRRAMDMDRHMDEPHRTRDWSEFHGSGASGTTTGRGKWEPLEPRRIRVRRGKEICPPTEAGRRSAGRIRWVESNIAKTCKRLLLSEVQTRHLYGQKKGKIHNKNLYRVGMKDAGPVRDRIFKRKDTKMDVDVAVYVLVDCSGSMKGGKFEAAANSAVQLAQALQSINVPVQVEGFTDTSALYIYEFKKFDARLDKAHMQGRFEAIATSLFNNDDPDAVYRAYNLLLQRKESRKLLIVLSDGSPSTSIISTDVREGLRDLVQAIEKEGKVETYGIGMMYGGVSKYYPKNETISDISKLEEALLKLIKSKIIKPR